MERGSLVGRRAMSGQVKTTDREGRREMCVQGSKGGGRSAEWGGNGCRTENGSVMS